MIEAPGSFAGTEAADGAAGDGVGHASAAPPLSRWRKTLIIAATTLGSSMAFIDATALNVALPAMQKDLGASLSGMQWVINGYNVVLAALVLSGGAAGDLFGRRAMFLAGVALFVLASVWCALVDDVAWLILARIVQGIGAALTVPASLSIIGSSFPAQERGRAVGLWAGMSALTTGLGPPLGGWLVEAYSWHAIFLINVPIGCATALLTLLAVPESRSGRAGGLDWPGSLSALVGLGGVNLALTAWADQVTQPELAGWLERVFLSVVAIAALVVGVAALVLFLVIEGRSSRPMMPLGLFRRRAFGGANLLTLFLYFALGGLIFFYPWQLQQVHRMSAFEAGAALLPFVLVMAAMSRWSGGLIDRFGSRLPLTAGPCVAALGLWLMGLPGAETPFWLGYLPAILVLALGMAITITPLSAVVIDSVPVTQVGVASGINNAVSRVAGVLAVGALGVLAAGSFDATLAVAASGENVVGLRFGGGAPADPEAARLYRLAMQAAFREVLGICAWLALLSAVVGWISQPPPKGRPLTRLLVHARRLAHLASARIAAWRAAQLAERRR